MKIHIDTAGEKEKAQAKNLAKKPVSSSPKPSQPSKPKPAPKPNLPKSPPKEPKAPKDVAVVRSRQTQILKDRQSSELAGKSDAFRESSGTGFYPTVSPFL